MTCIANMNNHDMQSKKLHVSSRLSRWLWIVSGIHSLPTAHAAVVSLVDRTALPCTQ